jgi:hypothetical protein
MVVVRWVAFAAIMIGRDANGKSSRKIFGEAVDKASDSWEGEARAEPLACWYSAHREVRPPENDHIMPMSTSGERAMCIFSQKASVSKTRIFARSGKDNTQYLVYSMIVKAEKELAMILPLPVAQMSKDITFINLEKYPEFFDDLGKGYPAPITRGNTKSVEKIAVVEVGSFIASYVPTAKDIGKLDEKFRLPDDVWDKLPQFKDYGFAVFQLKTGEKNIHPMALQFPRADKKRLYFPTVHVHDGKVAEKDDFDHTLYAQASNGENIIDWEESVQPVELFAKNFKNAQGILEGNEHLYRKEIKGKQKNEDVWLG